jgi:AcrR family transcriptional regulator
MPANRQHLDRDTKTRDILDSAETLMLRYGYDATSMAAVARGAGVANNAVYWYFPSKDDVLAAVLRRRLHRALAGLSELAPERVEERVLMLLAQLDHVASLTAAVHEGAERSPAVAEMHAEFHAAAERLLRAGFRQEGLGARDAAEASRAIMAIIEGVHLHERNRDAVARDRLVRWTLRRFIGAPARRRDVRAA